MSMIVRDDSIGYRHVVGWPNEPESAFHQTEAFDFIPPGPEDKRRHTQMDFLIELYTKLDRAENRFEQWRRQRSFFYRLTRGKSIPCVRPLHVQERMSKHRKPAIREDDGPTASTLRINNLLWWRNLPNLAVAELANEDEIAAHELATHQWD